MTANWEEEADRLVAESAGDPTGWFDRLYAAGAAGRVDMPWDRVDPHPVLAEWAHGLTGAGRRAVVVGSGLGADAAYLTELGFDALGFDISPTAVGVARRRFPGTRYQTADLLDLPENWLRAFDLVVEVITVQALPDPPRRQAISNVSRLVAPGGTLLAVAAVHSDDEPPGPPWPLRREEVEAFATDGLTPVRIEIVPVPGRPGDRRWRAEFRRDLS
jgi:SAM-dependent methyltransferase